jgi:hypothetical protein
MVQNNEPKPSSGHNIRSKPRAHIAGIGIATAVMIATLLWVLVNAASEKTAYIAASRECNVATKHYMEASQNYFDALDALKMNMRPGDSNSVDNQGNSGLSQVRHAMRPGTVLGDSARVAPPKSSIFSGSEGAGLILVILGLVGLMVDAVFVVIYSGEKDIKIAELDEVLKRQNEKHDSIKVIHKDLVDHLALHNARGAELFDYLKRYFSRAASFMGSRSGAEAARREQEFVQSVKAIFQTLHRMIVHGETNLEEEKTDNVIAQDLPASGYTEVCGVIYASGEKGQSDGHLPDFVSRCMYFLKTSPKYMSGEARVYMLTRLFTYQASDSVSNIREMDKAERIILYMYLMFNNVGLVNAHVHHYKPLTGEMRILETADYVFSRTFSRGSFSYKLWLAEPGNNEYCWPMYNNKALYEVFVRDFCARIVDGNADSQINSLNMSPGAISRKLGLGQDRDCCITLFRAIEDLVSDCRGVEELNENQGRVEEIIVEYLTALDFPLRRV